MGKGGLVTLLSGLSIIGALTGSSIAQPILKPEDLNKEFGTGLITRHPRIFLSQEEQELEDVVRSFLGRDVLYQTYNDVCPAYRHKGTYMGYGLRFGFPNPDLQQGILNLFVTRFNDHSYSNYENFSIGPTSVYLIYRQGMNVWTESESHLIRRLRDGKLGIRTVDNMKSSSFFYILDFIDKQAIKSGAEVLNVTQTFLKGILVSAGILLEGPSIEEMEMKYSLQINEPIVIERFYVYPPFSWADVHDVKALRFHFSWSGTGSNAKEQRPFFVCVNSQTDLTLIPDAPFLNEIQLKTAGINGEVKILQRH